ncbi:MAG: apolipoprotein N-acyltransferase [Sphingomonadaceae bacterium]
MHEPQIRTRPGPLLRAGRWVDAHPRLSAPIFGALAATGFPPLELWWVAIPAVAGLAWLVWRSANWRQAALIGWLFGVAHFTVTNNWIATAFTYQANMPVALGWAAVPLLSLYLAVWPGFAAGAARAMARRGSLGAFGFAFAASWIAGEWLRSWVFTGYAWGPLSLMLLGPFSRPGAAMLLPWIGTYALSGVVVLVATSLLALLLARQWIGAGALAAVVAALMLWPAGQGRQGTLPFTLVQPNIPQEEIDDPTKFESQFATLAKLSVKRRDVSHRIVLWPEGAIPDYLRPGYPQRYYDEMTAMGDPAFARRRLGYIAGPGGLMLLGSIDLKIGGNANYPRAVGAYNTITAIDSEGKILGGYAKAHLVPYGEYLPMKWLLKPLGLSRLVSGSIDFLPGPGPRTLDFGPWGKAGMQICYEIVFSGRVIDESHRPDYIFNPSNDGWFGEWGPPQHLAQARMRAIEDGLPILRSTTSGISAVIDARGVVRAHLGRRVAGRIDGLVPPPLPPTLFARLGIWLTLVWGVLLLGGWLVASRLADRYWRRT